MCSDDDGNTFPETVCEDKSRPEVRRNCDEDRLEEDDDDDDEKGVENGGQEQAAAVRWCILIQYSTVLP